MTIKIEITENDFRTIADLLERRVIGLQNYKEIKNAVELNERFLKAFNDLKPRLKNCICEPQCANDQNDYNNCKACEDKQIPF